MNRSAISPYTPVFAPFRFSTPVKCGPQSWRTKLQTDVRAAHSTTGSTMMPKKNMLLLPETLVAVTRMV